MFWVAIVGLNVLVNSLNEFVDAFEDSSPNPLLGDLGEPAFNLIEPRPAGWREMQVVTRMPLEPGRDLRGFVRRVVGKRAVNPMVPNLF